MNSLYSVFLRARASRFVLTGLLALASVNSASAVSSLWSEYALTPDTHLNIPNCSYAGYHYGEDPIPHIVATPANTYNVKTTYGALGNGMADDTAAIRAALAAALAAGGGVVYFPNGHYLVSGVLFVNSSNTVLRGESQSGTEIVFTNPLNSGYGTANITGDSGNPASKWSFSGGLIWFGPLVRGNTYRPAGELPTDPLTSGEFVESWLTAGVEGTLSAAVRGARSVTLDRTPTVHAGDFVLLRQTDPGDFSLVKHLAGGGTWADAYDWANGTGNASWNPPGDLQWVVEVAAVSGTTITFRQPLRFDVRTAWTPTLDRLGSLLRESGIEDISLKFNRTYQWSTDKHHNEEGWNAPYFNNAVHCWLRNVTMTDMDSGPNISASKLVTLTGFTLKASGEARMAHHHGTITRASSHDNLICDFSILSQPYHGLNGERMSTGNVWTRGVADHGIFDSHRGEPFEGIRTDVDMVANDGTHGGGGGPLMGARFVNWNVSTHISTDTPPGTGSNYMMGWANAMPMGAIVGLRGCQTTTQASSSNTPTGSYSSCRIEGTGLVPDPENLYEAQLALRFKSTVIVFPDVIVDNTDSSRIFAVGSWGAATSTPGYYGVDYLNDFNTGKGTKSFSFKPEIPSTGDYQVYLRWPANSTRATVVPVDIIKSDGSVTTVTVNQRNNNNQWFLLGLYTLSPSNAELKIRTTGATDGYVIADAAKVTATNGIVDNAETARVVAVGTWSSSTGSPGYFGADYANDGNTTPKGSKSFSFKPVIPMSGNYNIYLRWTSASNRASNVPVDIVQKDESVTTVVVNQQTGGGGWVKLGGDWSLSPTNAEVKIRTTGTNGYVIADAIKVTPATP